MVVVVKCLDGHALTQRLRLEEQTVKGPAYALNRAMKMDVLVNTLNTYVVTFFLIFELVER